MASNLQTLISTLLNQASGLCSTKCSCTLWPTSCHGWSRKKAERAERPRPPRTDSQMLTTSMYCRDSIWSLRAEFRLSVLTNSSFHLVTMGWIQIKLSVLLTNFPFPLQTPHDVPQGSVFWKLISYNGRGEERKSRSAVRKLSWTQNSSYKFQKGLGLSTGIGYN